MRTPLSRNPLLAAAVVLVAAFLGYQGLETGGGDVPVAPAVGSDAVARAYAGRRSDVIVEGSGVVERVLADDTQGSRHQRFILRLAPELTLLVAHNIDLAPRVAGLRAGDGVSFRGEYEWNERGGVLHWTHHDPQGRHPGGWLEHGGQRYE